VSSARNREIFYEVTTEGGASSGRIVANVAAVSIVANVAAVST